MELLLHYKRSYCHLWQLQCTLIIKPGHRVCSCLNAQAAHNHWTTYVILMHQMVLPLCWSCDTCNSTASTLKCYIFLDTMRECCPTVTEILQTFFNRLLKYALFKVWMNYSMLFQMLSPSPCGYQLRMPVWLCWDFTSDTASTDTSRWMTVH